LVEASVPHPLANFDVGVAGCAVLANAHTQQGAVVLNLKRARALAVVLVPKNLGPFANFRQTLARTAFGVPEFTFTARHRREVGGA